MIFKYIYTYLYNMFIFIHIYKYIYKYIYIHDIFWVSFCINWHWKVLVPFPTNRFCGVYAINSTIKHHKTTGAWINQKVSFFSTLSHLRRKHHLFGHGTIFWEWQLRSFLWHLFWYDFEGHAICGERQWAADPFQYGGSIRKWQHFKDGVYSRFSYLDETFGTKYDSQFIISTAWTDCTSHFEGLGFSIASLCLSLCLYGCLDTIVCRFGLYGRCSGRNRGNKTGFNN